MTTLKYPGLTHQPGGDARQGRLAQAIRQVLRTQFGRPSGLLGNVAGLIMAHRRSNLDRIRWTVSLLDVQAKDRVLEVGFGPGVAIELLSRIVTEGFIAGVDHSQEMVRQAVKRNAEAIRAGRVSLQRASASAPPQFSEPFDKIFTINAIHFWEDPVECLTKLRQRLRPGGLIAVTLQPRMRAATDATAAVLAEEIVANLERAGFSSCEVKIKRTQAGAVACVLATN